MYVALAGGTVAQKATVTESSRQALRGHRRALQVWSADGTDIDCWHFKLIGTYRAGSTPRDPNMSRRDAALGRRPILVHWGNRRQRRNED